MKRKFTKITALLVTVALLMAVPTLSAYANEENTTAVLSESAAQSTTNNIKESTTVQLKTALPIKAAITVLCPLTKTEK